MKCTAILCHFSRDLFSFLGGSGAAISLALLLSCPLPILPPARHAFLPLFAFPSIPLILTVCCLLCSVIWLVRVTALHFHGDSLKAYGQCSALALALWPNVKGLSCWARRFWPAVHMYWPFSMAPCALCRANEEIRQRRVSGCIQWSAADHAR